MTRGARTAGWMWTAGWTAWWGLWALITLPWGASEPNPQWHRVEWVPFQFGLLRDAVLNFLFFVPFGMLALRRRRAGRAIAAAAVVSVATELIQLYGAGRYPSATDIVVNITGAAAGVAWLRPWRVSAAAAGTSRDPIPPSARSRPR